MSAITIMATELRRYLRDRTALFFVVVLPVLIIVILGVTVTGMGKMRVAVVNEDRSPFAARLDDALHASPALKVDDVADADTARTGVRRGEHAAALVIPAGYGSQLTAGQDVALALYGDPTSTNEQAAASAVRSVVNDQAAQVQAARFAAGVGAGTFDTNLTVAERASTVASPIEVRGVTIDSSRNYLPEGFSYSAPTMLVLFVFINALAGGAALIESRNLGMQERMLAAPITSRSIVIGETLCYFGLALVQSLLIVGIGTLLFDVSWGDPVAAIALVLAWALVGTGAGVLSGTLFRTSQQASSIGPAVGIGLGMLGGCMWPLEIVPSAMRTLGHFFPHAWAIDGWTTVLSKNGGLVDILRPLAVLAVFAAMLLFFATTRLRRIVVR
jgi:ABC-2 type transport system permease protein